MNKHGHKCEEAGCSKEAPEYPYINQWADNPEDDKVWLCDDHAVEAGFCLSCHYFCAGMESYDFSPVKGYCHECLSEIADEDDWEDGYDDFSYSTGYDLIEDEEYGVDISPKNDTMGGVE